MDMKHSRKGGLTGRQKKQIRLVLLLLPFMIMIGIFSYAPLFGWSYAFVEFTPGVSIFKSQFVGLKYFKKDFRKFKRFCDRNEKHTEYFIFEHLLFRASSYFCNCNFTA